MRGNVPPRQLPYSLMDRAGADLFVLSGLLPKMLYLRLSYAVCRP